MLAKLLAVLECLNWHYGRGDVVSVTLDKSGETGYVTRRIPLTPETGFEEKRKITVLNGCKVRFLGRTRSFT